MRLFKSIIAVLTVTLTPVAAYAQTAWQTEQCKATAANWTIGVDRNLYMMFKQFGIIVEDQYLRTLNQAVEAASSVCPGANPYSIAEQLFMPRSTEIYRSLVEKQSSDQQEAGQHYGIN